MNVIILGCGRVGSRLATLMERDGHQVSIIDSDPGSFARLPEDFEGQTVLGTGIDVDVLKSAGIEKADAFAAVTNFDNTNIMASEIAKEIFGIDNVLARIYDPGRESFYHELGLETVCPTTLISTTVHDILSAPRTPRRPRADTTSPAGTLEDAGAAVAAALPSGPGTATTQQSAGATNAATHEAQGRSATPIQPGDVQEPHDNGRGLRGIFRP